MKADQLRLKTGDVIGLNSAGIERIGQQAITSLNQYVDQNRDNLAPKEIADRTRAAVRMDNAVTAYCAFPKIPPWQFRVRVERLENLGGHKIVSLRRDKGLFIEVGSDENVLVPTPGVIIKSGLRALGIKI